MGPTYFHLSPAQRLPFRALHLGLVVLGYYYVKRGADSIFDDANDGAAARAMMIPSKMRY